MIAKGGGSVKRNQIPREVPVTVEAGFERKRDRRAGKNSGRA